MKPLDFLPAAAVRTEILDKAAALFRSLLDANFDQACVDSAEAYQSDPDSPEPVMKINFALAYALFARDRKINLAAKWSAPRKDEAEAPIDGTQCRLEFAPEPAPEADAQ